MRAAAIADGDHATRAAREAIDRIRLPRPQHDRFIGLLLFLLLRFREPQIAVGPADTGATHEEAHRNASDPALSAGRRSDPGACPKPVCTCLAESGGKILGSCTEPDTAHVYCQHGARRKVTEFDDVVRTSETGAIPAGPIGCEDWVSIPNREGPHGFMGRSGDRTADP
jgi:hypothetical protein